MKVVGRWQGYQDGMYPNRYSGNLACSYQQVQQKYYPVVEQMLKRVTGATRTLIFDHTLRNGRIK